MKEIKAKKKRPEILKEGRKRNGVAIMFLL